MRTAQRTTANNTQPQKSAVALMWEKIPENCYEYLDMRAVLK